MKKNLVVTIYLLFVANYLLGQVNGPPLPCNTGTENTCKCFTSPVLCSLSELDGYEYDMTLFQHPADGPQPMCPGSQGVGTTSNNPTWFAFLTWCDSLKIDIIYTNCTDPAGPSVGGIQAAVYSNCPATPANAVACATSVSGCTSSGVRSMNLQNLIPGSVYYLLVDGCAGSACHIEIDVTSTCNQAMATPLTFVNSTDVVCKPNAQGTYKVSQNEHKIFYWYIDGTQVQQDTGLTQTVLDFSNYSLGLHQVCVDGSNPPCYYENSFPPAVCRDVCVAPAESDAGSIIFNSPACVNNSVSFSIVGSNLSSGFINRVFAADANGTIIFTSPLNANSGSFSNPNCSNFTLYSVNYYSLCAPNFPIPTIGMNVSEILNSCSNCGCDIKQRSLNATVNYSSTSDDFVNPERGWYRHTETYANNYSLLDSATLAGYRQLHTPSSPPANYNVYSSLVLRLFYLEAFKNGPISAIYLQNIQADLNTARKAGIKLIPRFAYTNTVNASGCSSWICPPYGDASKVIILSHLNQLKPILEANKDVIATLQMGFIGTWGEQYYTDFFGDASQLPYSYNSTNWTDRKMVVDSLLKVLPKELNLQVRYPQIKQKSVYGISAPVTSAPLTLSEAFTGTNKSRIGYHNDCFLASADDFGTYANYDNGNSDTTNLKPYKAQDSKYVMVGGETCSSSIYSGCGNAVYEMGRMHYTYLNADYNTAVNNSWVTQGCIEDVKKKLGYRLFITSAEYSNQILVGSQLNYKINITNEGFAAPANKRLVNLVLVNNATNEEYIVSLNDDPRKWLTGNHVIEGSACISSCVSPGSYKMFLHLADPNPSLSNRPEYSIRLANVNSWNASKGYNDLNHTLTISSGSGNCTSGIKFTRNSINKWIGPNVGNWNDAMSSWSLNRLPDYCDEVLIDANKIITVPQGYVAKAKKVSVSTGGKIVIPVGAKLDVEN